MPRYDGSPTRAEKKAERRAHCQSGRSVLPKRSQRDRVFDANRGISLNRKQVLALSELQLREILSLHYDDGKYTDATVVLVERVFHGGA